MTDIRCPNCGKEFQIDEKGYAAIAAQVRDLQFNKEIDLIREHFRMEKEREIQSLEEKHELEIQKMEDVIERYRDFKIRLDNKSLGESLEQYCLHEFENIRGLLSPNVIFEKDNEAKKGDTKGDFIYRETDDDGTEILSVMFEMKTEFDDSSNKKKNTEHLDKLDKDRIKKNCEYAVLVTMLEADNEYYNRGIVRAPGSYEKMYVVRPQCFLTIISILRNVGLNNLEYRREIESLKKDKADISQFEANLEDFKNDFRTSAENAAKNYNDAITEINKVIASLEKIRDQYLVKSGKHLNTAVKKTDKLTIKKLTKNAPLLKQQFIELETSGSEE